jgi:hypothetical protein
MLPLKKIIPILYAWFASAHLEEITDNPIWLFTHTQ